jgi:hypothetical protein
MMLPVFPPSIFFNRIPQAQSAAAGGRSSGGFFFGFDPKAAAYKAGGVDWSIGAVRSNGVSRCDSRVLAVDSSEMNRVTPPNETVPTDGLIGVRDRTLLLFAWASGGRRRSEVTGAVMEQLIAIDANTYLYRLIHSKTDRAGAANQIENPLVGVAATALTEWLQASKITSGPIFRRIRGSVVVEALEPQAVRDIVKRRAALAGLNGDFSALSLRSGFMTEAGRQNVTWPKQWHLPGIAACRRPCGISRRVLWRSPGRETYWELRRRESDVCDSRSLSPNGICRSTPNHKCGLLKSQGMFWSSRPRQRRKGEMGNRPGRVRHSPLKWCRTCGVLTKLWKTTLYGAQGVASSNLVAPTNYLRGLRFPIGYTLRYTFGTGETASVLLPSFSLG